MAGVAPAPPGRPGTLLLGDIVSEKCVWHVAYGVHLHAAGVRRNVVRRRDSNEMSVDEEDRLLLRFSSLVCLSFKGQWRSMHQEQIVDGGYERL